MFDANETLQYLEGSYGLYVPTPFSTSIVIMIAIASFAGIFFIASELFPGVHIAYSKFAGDDVLNSSVKLWQRLFHWQMHAKPGFTILYGLPVVTYVICLVCILFVNKRDLGTFTRQSNATYFSVLSAMFLGTFVKRVLEVRFLHIYSSTLPVLSACFIGLGYSMFGCMSALASNQVQEYPGLYPESPTFVKDVCCIVFYFVFLSLNFWTHYRLRQVRLRKDHLVEEGDIAKKYYAPKEIGFLFELFICPHYLFEFLGFSAMLVYCGTIVHHLFILMELGYLGLRTRSTYRWYKERNLI